MTRRRYIWLTGGAAFVLMVVLTVLDGVMMDTGGPGIIGFEFAGTEARAQEILAEWGRRGRDAAQLSLVLDFGYLVAYGAFLTLMVAWVRSAAEKRKWKRLAGAGGVIVYAPLATATFDALENVCLLAALDGRGGGVAPLLGMIFAIAKFTCVAMVGGYLLAALFMRVARPSAPG